MRIHPYTLYPSVHARKHAFIHPSSILSSTHTSSVHPFIHASIHHVCIYLYYLNLKRPWRVPLIDVVHVKVTDGFDMGEL